MAAYQRSFEMHTKGRTAREITSEVAEHIKSSGIACGIAHIFVPHTSCSLIITENADPAVPHDLEMLARRWAPDADPQYRHDTEGDDDMPAHARNVLTGSSVSVPIADGAMVLGTCQGIYLWEHRGNAHLRKIVVTVVG